MSDTEKNLLKCVESLYSVVATLAVILDYEGKVREDEAKAINRAFSAYNSAHYDILHQEVDG